MATSELVEHLGEVHLRVLGGTLAELLAESARALGELERQSIPVEDGTLRREVALAAPDLVSLFVDWLNELIYLSETGPWTPEQAQIHLADEREIRATVSGPRLAAPPSLVKAATLHRAKVMQTPDGWLAEVLLDV